MYKIIIISLCVLLGFAACRSGKGVTQAKGGKDSVNKVTSSTNDTVKVNTGTIVKLSAQEQARVDSIFQALIHDTTKPIVHPTPAEREENRKFAEELKSGTAYSHNPNRLVEYVLIKPIPAVIEKMFPDILIYQERNMMGQGSGSPYVNAVYNEERIGLPNLSKLYNTNKNIPIQIQFEVILSVMEYPFPAYSIDSNLISEEKKFEYGNVFLNYKMNGTYKGERCEFWAFVQKDTIKLLAIYVSDKYKTHIDLR